VLCEHFYSSGEFFVERSDIFGSGSISFGYLDAVGMKCEPVDKRSFGPAFFESEAGLEVGEHDRPVRSIQRVHGKRHSFISQVNPYLVCPSGQWLDREQCRETEVGKKSVVSNGGFSSFSVNSHKLRVFSTVGEGDIYSAGPICDKSGYNGEVSFFY